MTKKTLTKQKLSLTKILEIMTEIHTKLEKITHKMSGKSLAGSNIDEDLDITIKAMYRMTDIVNDAISIGYEALEINTDIRKIKI